MELEVCLLNSLSKYSANGMVFRTQVPEGTTVAALLRRLSRPRCEIYVAFSGPVPFSRGYGAPAI